MSAYKKREREDSHPKVRENTLPIANDPGCDF